ncbi:TetR/AcrR family transcriptional regulator [Conexibacter arvalis]|uniref:AcrR family transcriptional regulator n=1 Tax=Conexibacter arvalis TaxID=912552 RepID=A0A840IIQ3_9ACTN|nr:TetR/AcrR family transcriptional regulator [Conexibacter arvalis]MBB4664967.1 AcrR family transcriptional regulator [Conexibacter arvalis]
MSEGSTKTKWQVKREASREALVNAAMRRFVEQGYARIRVEDIVEGTGYTKGAFYFHFANKLECFWAVIAHLDERRGDWVAGMAEALEPETTLEEALTRVFAGFEESNGGVASWVLVMIDFLQQHRDDAEVRARLGAVYANWHGQIARGVAALQAADLVTTARDADLLATEVYAYVQGLTAHTHLYGLEPERVQAALVDGLVALLGRDG